MLLFNFVDYVFLLSCSVLLLLFLLPNPFVMFMYSYCCAYSVLGIQYHCVVLCIVCL